MDAASESHLAADRSRAQRWLIAQLNELEVLYDTAPVGLGLVDAELRFVRINERLAQMNGRSVAAHIGATIRAVVPTLADVLEPIYRRVLDSGEPVLNVQIHGAQPAVTGEVGDWLASYRPMRAGDGRVLAVSVVVQEITDLQRARRAVENAQAVLEQRVAERTAELHETTERLRSEITERERARAALGASEQRYRELIETIRDAVFTVDECGRLTYVSPVFELMSGYRPDEMIGRPYTDVLHPDDLAAAARSFGQSLAGAGQPFECRVFTKSGAERWVRTCSRLVRNPDGSAELRGVLTDVTDRRHAEQRAHVQLGELAHVQRIATVGELTAQVAHEVNQPLAAIVNFADGLVLRLREEVIDRAAMRDVAAQIASEGRRAAEVIRRLRDFARKGAIQAEATDVNGLVQDVVRLCESDAQRQGIAIHLQLDPQSITICLDRIQIQQVVMNLLRNGLDAVSHVGARERAVMLRTRGDTDGVLLSVRDGGIGLPPGAVEQVFDAFFTTKPDGLGIGLAISRSIVEAHGGRVWAERNPSGGTTFHVSLPSAPA